MKFLVFQHVPHEHPGLIIHYAAERSIEMDIVKLWEPYRIPAVSQYDALVIMGGPMGVYDGKGVYPSKDDELQAIRSALGKVPIIGFCLGSQLLAHALGSRVYPNTIEGRRAKEVGYYTVDLTPNGAKDPLFKGFSSPIKVLQWHGDAFDLPKGAELLATSPLCRNQAFSYGKAYGLLFHLEFTPEMVARQIEIDRDWIHKENEIDETQLTAETERNADLMQRQSTRLLDNFVSVVES
ncbi:MAG: type 1 glutamine amidotransferase [Planctomycetes bacterium]|nr:type 1 glutamine amidotransferase [Planctomycetota bacterium]